MLTRAYKGNILASQKSDEISWLMLNVDAVMSFQHSVTYKVVMKTDGLSINDLFLVYHRRLNFLIHRLSVYKIYV